MQAKLLSFVSKFTCKYKLFLLAFCWSCFLALGITFVYHNQDISVSLMRSVACSKVSIVRLIVVSYIPFLAVALASRFRLLVFAIFVCALKALGIGFVLASCCVAFRSAAWLAAIFLLFRDSLLNVFLLEFCYESFYMHRQCSIHHLIALFIICAVLGGLDYCIAGLYVF